MIAWLTDPFTLQFMQRALHRLGDRRRTLLGDGHASWCCARWRFSETPWRTPSSPAWPSPTCSGANLLLGALVAAVLVAVGIGAFSRRGGLKEDTAIGILFAAALALGVLLMSTVRSYATDLTHILFGNVLGVSAGDLWLTGILAVVVPRGALRCSSRSSSWRRSTRCSRTCWASGRRRCGSRC